MNTFGLYRDWVRRRGLSLIEILLAISILSMISVLLMVTVPAIYRGLQSASERSVATSLAQNRVALAEREGTENAEPTVLIVDGVEYTVEVAYGQVMDEEGSALEEERIRSMEVTVSWDVRNGRQSQKVKTFLASRGD